MTGPLYRILSQRASTSETLAREMGRKASFFRSWSGIFY